MKKHSTILKTLLPGHRASATKTGALQPSQYPITTLEPESIFRKPVHSCQPAIPISHIVSQNPHKQLSGGGRGKTNSVASCANV